MSVILFHQDKEFVCPCGCKRKFRLSIQHSSSYGWNAFVTSRKKDVAEVGENGDCDDCD